MPFSIAADHSVATTWSSWCHLLAGQRKHWFVKCFDSCNCYPVSCWAMQGSALYYVPRVLLRIGLLLSLLQRCHNASLPPDHHAAAAPPKLVSGITAIVNNVQDYSSAIIFTCIHCMYVYAPYKCNISIWLTVRIHFCIWCVAYMYIVCAIILSA